MGSEMCIRDRYMSQAFIFLAPRFDRELAEAREKRIEHEHEYLDEA